MRAVRLPFFACLTILSIAACGTRDPVDHAARDPVALPATNEEAPSATGAPRGETQPASTTPEAAATIPAALQGRWALAPADCEPGRSDAKGLLTITSDGMRFYESRAVPNANVRADGDSLSGDFSFTGEGQSWTKFQSLQLQQQGLVRTESNPTASFTYAKCD